MSIFGLSTTMAGDCFAFPDVCLTIAGPATVPIPYPNMAMCLQASVSYDKVHILAANVVRVGDKIPMSTGDQAGNAPGGIMSGRFGDQVQFKKGSTKVKVGGKSAAMHLSLTAHNGSNPNMPAGTQMSPSQTKVRVIG